jgi:hypothetical protein
MLKTLAFVVAGLAAGFAIAVWLAPGAPAASDTMSSSAAPAALDGSRDAAASTARLASLEDALAAETERRTELEQRVGELAAALDELRAAASSARGGAENAPAGRELATGEVVGPRGRLPGGDPAARAQEMQRRQVELLVQAGFAPDRAEWIIRRAQELRMVEMQAQYEAQREGRTVDPALALGSDGTLRNELGDAEYERYLAANNRPTRIEVMQVLASSPAERVGLKPGDQIVSYGGTRVFDASELNALTFKGNPGESVVVEIRRAGQPLQLVVPSGPLGIMGGFRGQRVPVGR